MKKRKTMKPYFILVRPKSGGPWYKTGLEGKAALSPERPATWVPALDSIKHVLSYLRTNNPDMEYRLEPLHARRAA